MDLGRLSSGFHRARWMAELAAVLAEAEDVAGGLRAATGPDPELDALRERISAARRELEDLRLGGWRAPVQEIGSKWIEFLPATASDPRGNLSAA